MIADEFAVPEGSEADYLLQGLARLIQLRGAETFVAAPLLLAEPRYFPDRVEPRAPGVSVLLRRLLAYAGLTPARLDIEIYGAVERDAYVTPDEAPDHAAAWFMDIAEGVYRFGVRESELSDEQGLIGTLGHEVAHAYRAHHGLVMPSRDVEEQLTDLTTVYLGFGVFTLESSFQFKTGHYSASGQQLLYERQARGYLRPGQLAFLLAAQLVARGTREDLLDAALASLSDNHAAAVKAAVKQLRADQDALLHGLGLPATAAWPPPRELASALTTLPETAVVIHDHAQSGREQHKEQRFGFRVAGTRLGWGLSAGLSAGFFLGIVGELQLAFWPCTLALAGLGAFMGRRIASPTCSGCARNVAPHAARCAFCELRLVGDIANQLERFEAEQRYRESGRLRE